MTKKSARILTSLGASFGGTIGFSIAMLFGSNGFYKNGFDVGDTIGLVVGAVVGFIAAFLISYWLIGKIKMYTMFV